MIILGIDPGVRKVGYGVIEKSGKSVLYKTSGLIEPEKMPLAEQLKYIESRIEDIIQRERPKIAGVELLFFSKNKKTALAVAHARGVIINILARHSIKIIELSPADVKIGVTGYGNAAKKSVASMVEKILGIKTKNSADDITDALAIAITAAFTSSFGVDNISH